MIKTRRGQNLLDYTILLLIAVAALMIMGYYIRNSLSGKMRDGADTIGRGETYRPGATAVNTTVTNIRQE